MKDRWIEYDPNTLILLQWETAEEAEPFYKVSVVVHNNGEAKIYWSIGNINNTEDPKRWTWHQNDGIWGIRRRLSKAAEDMVMNWLIENNWGKW